MYIKAVAAQQGCKTLTVACLNIKTWNNQLNVKNLEKSTELSEFLKLHSVLKSTTSLGKKFQMLLHELMAACSTEPALLQVLSFTNKAGSWDKIVAKSDNM